MEDRFGWIKIGPATEYNGSTILEEIPNRKLFPPLQKEGMADRLSDVRACTPAIPTTLAGSNLELPNVPFVHFVHGCKRITAFPTGQIRAYIGVIVLARLLRSQACHSPNEKLIIDLKH